MKNWIILFALFFVISSCDDGDNHESEMDQEESMEESTEAQTTTMAYTLTPFTPSPSFEDATLTNMNYQSGTFDFTVSGTTYQLGEQTSDAPQKMCANSAQGQHIHLIVDDLPYAAKYVSSFEHDVTDGEHYILAFLSRSYHESIKTDAAHIVEKVTVSNKAITESSEVTDPMIFYSRPKGTYVGSNDTEKVMLDFYLANLDLGANYRVKAKINGEEHMIDTWQPYYIEGLPMGENTIELTLVDGNGQVVDTPLNPVTRTFTLQADPAENQ